MSVTTLYLLRLLHVAIGAFWVGSIVFIAVFLMPSIRGAGPGGGAVMQQLTQVRRLPLWLMAAAILTVLSGFALYWHDLGGFTSAWQGSGTGRGFGLGGVLALLGVIVGMAVNSPAAIRLGRITGRVQAEGRPPAPDEVATMQALQVRLSRGTVAVAVLLVMATLAMAVARYVP